MDGSIDRRKLIIAGAAVAGLVAALLWTRRSYEAEIQQKPSKAQKKGLKIIVVGAGIAGLTTAVALRQAGHVVEVREIFSDTEMLDFSLILFARSSRSRHLRQKLEQR